MIKCDIDIILGAVKRASFVRAAQLLSGWHCCHVFHVPAVSPVIRNIPG